MLLLFQPIPLSIFHEKIIKACYFFFAVASSNPLAYCIKSKILIWYTLVLILFDDDLSQQPQSLLTALQNFLSCSLLQLYLSLLSYLILGKKNPPPSLPSQIQALLRKTHFSSSLINHLIQASSCL